ncbi:MAG TPA: cyclic nucleotide-binding domain-containing protein [Bacteriovoracaceae bacterium]|nr:cyclic nucleotide-binding domain-containing protein [Bacteriovoracaceae bacterium]
MENSLNLDFKSVVFKEGQRATKLYLIKAGEVLCLKNSKGRLIPVFSAKAGDIVGESSMLANSNYTYSAVTLDRTTLIEIPAKTFEEILKTAPEWVGDLAATMIDRFHRTSNMVAENRLIHSSIISEEAFTSSLEIEFKKLLS